MIRFDSLSSGLTYGDLRFNGNYVNDAGRLFPHQADDLLQ